MNRCNFQSILSIHDENNICGYLLPADINRQKYRLINRSEIPIRRIRFGETKNVFNDFTFYTRIPRIVFV